jgi:gas vesicle protein
MNIKTGFIGFALGALAGAAIGLLYAPQSGDETRQILAENSQKLKEDTLDSIQQAQDLALEKVNEAQVRFEAINKESKELLTRLQSIGQSTLEAEKDILAEGYEETKEAVAA